VLPLVVGDELEKLELPLREHAGLPGALSGQKIPNVLWVFSFLVNPAESPKTVTG
jgi:hypothetical protein